MCAPGEHNNINHRILIYASLFSVYHKTFIFFSQEAYVAKMPVRHMVGENFQF